MFLRIREHQEIPGPAGIVVMFPSPWIGSSPGELGAAGLCIDGASGFLEGASGGHIIRADIPGYTRVGGLSLPCS